MGVWGADRVRPDFAGADAYARSMPALCSLYARGVSAWLCHCDWWLRRGQGVVWVALCHWDWRAIRRVGGAVSLGLAGKVSCGWRCVIGIGRAGAVPLGLAGKAWRRVGGAVPLGLVAEALHGGRVSGAVPLGLVGRHSVA